jgi:hypothetical protein
MVGALRESCDVYFYEVAQRIGIDGIFAMNDRLGLGQKYDLPLSGMAHGNNPSRAWKQERYGQDWLIGDTINASIGQGFTLASPIQLATMTARLASGTAVLPASGAPATVGPVRMTPAPAPLGLSADALAIVRQGMFEVSNHERGTAYASRIADVTLAMAGKTGSSQVFSITAAERAAGVRSQDELPWNRRDHALFVAFAPFDAPRYAVTVVVEHGGGGSTAAAPIARDIMLFAQHGGLPPEDAYPTCAEGAHTGGSGPAVRTHPAAGRDTDRHREPDMRHQAQKWQVPRRSCELLRARPRSAVCTASEAFFHNSPISNKVAPFTRNVRVLSRCQSGRAAGLAVGEGGRHLSRAAPRRDAATPGTMATRCCATTSVAAGRRCWTIWASTSPPACPALAAS